MTTGKSCVAKIVMTGSAEDGPDWQQHIRNKDKRRAAREPLQRSEGPIPDRDRARHVADRLRRAVAQHDVCRQADARPRPHAGHRAREPRLPRQAGRLGRRLPRPRRSTEAGARQLHRKRRQRRPELRHRAGHRRDAGEARDRLRHDARLRLVEVARRHAGREDWRSSRRRRSTSSNRRTARSASSRSSPSSRKPSPSAPPAKKRSRSATTSASSKPSKPRWPNRAANERHPRALDHAVRQLVAKAIIPEGEIIDVFTAAGLKQPDISILSDQFLAEVRGLKYKNVAAELLAKLLGDEIKVRSKRNLVQSREFSRDAQEDAQRLSQPRDRDAGSHRRTDQARQGTERRRPSAVSTSA